MQVNLVVTQGGQQGQMIPVGSREFCIGRHSSCDWRTDFMIVSRRHAAIVVRPDRVLVRDLGSRNGTFVNGRVVAGECEVRHDDRLAIGPIEFRFQVQPPKQADDATMMIELDDRPVSMPVNQASPDAAPADAAASDSCPLPSPSAKKIAGRWFAFLPQPAYALMRDYLFRTDK